jgi:hypothetical protein
LRVVCVIGMHRSGTSVVTRMLNLLGVSLGPEEELLEPAARNPVGFWENERVVALNDELLAALGGNATTPQVLADGWERASELDSLRERAAALVGSLADRAGVVGLKDPRLSLTLPFWRTVTPVARVVHCLRDPVETAPSLSRWHPIGVAASGELWLRYVVSACRTGTQLLVMYDDVLARPEEVARRLAAALELPAPTAETLEEIRSFVDSQLRRFHSGDGVDGQLALPSLLYRVLQDGGLPSAMPLVELLHRSWLLDAEARQTKALLEELASAERALRGRLAVRAALRLVHPAGPLLRGLRGRSGGGAGG